MAKLVPTGRTNRAIPGGVPSRFPGSARIPTSRRATARPVQGYPGHVRLRDPKGQFVKNGSGVSMFGLEAVAERLQQVVGSVMGSARQGAVKIAAEMEQYAKVNAPWEDRTGNARRTMKAVVVDEASGSFTIYLGYSVYYGIFLEFKDGGKYAIVQPTLAHFAGTVMGTIRNTISFNAGSGVHEPLFRFAP